MRIGIYSCYRKVDSTHAALALAGHLRARGTPVSVRVRGWRVPHVDPDWDDRVLGGGRRFHPHADDCRRGAQARERNAFRRWVASCSDVVWTEPPDEDNLYWASRVAKKRQTLWCGWDAVRDEDEWCLNVMNLVLMPSRQQAEAVRARFKLENVGVAPYCPYAPPTVKEPNFDGVFRVFMSLYGSQLRRVERPILGVIARALRASPRMTVVLACSKGLKGCLVRELKRMAADFGGRLGVAFDCPWFEQTLLMSQADLTLWPCFSDGLGLVGRHSLAAGTPVLAFRVPPVSEYLTHGVNAHLIPCQLDRNWLGAHRARPDYNALAKALCDFAANPQSATILSFGTAGAHEALIRTHAAAWEQHLPA